MPTCCAPFEGVADEQFNRDKASAELKRYREKGARPTTRLLETGLTEGDGVHGTLLDIGSGIGSLTFALLKRGMNHAVAVDASSAYIEAARGEAERLGRTADVQLVRGDFVSLSEELPPATVVTLDRVVCCYPFYEPLLNAALRHAERCFAFSYPRDVWYVRLALLLENALRRLKGNAFRTFVHPPTKMEELLRRHGWSLASRRQTWMWSVDVYRR
jgi:magnesium-protoporphyrin O-methyltransferase